MEDDQGQGDGEGRSGVNRTFCCCLGLALTDGGFIFEKLAISAAKGVLVEQVAGFESIYKEIIPKMKIILSKENMSWLNQAMLML